MAPAAYAKLYKITSTRRYIDTLDKYWWDTAKRLYDTTSHLWFRDSTYLYPAHKTANGSKIFWSCGNAWVIGGLARTIPNLPADYPTRQKFIDHYKEMIVAIKAQQGTNGLWTTSMLDHTQYPDPEVSGTAFFGFAMAWGVLNGYLDKATYLPVIKKAWTGCVQNVAANGKVRRCQWMGSKPAGGFYDTTTMEGQGAFLLFGNEINKLLTAVATLPNSAKAQQLPGLTLRMTAHELYITVPGSVSGASILDIFDISGRKIDGLNITAVSSGNTTLFSINNDRLKNGCYTLRITMNTIVFVDKIIVTH
jgi:hypothetical protein